jgi:hypothetical protein
MAKHVVRQGDCIASLAARYGISEDALLGRSGNDELKQLRKNPNILAPGDVVDVPDGLPDPLSLSVGSANPFKATIPQARVHVKVLDRAGQPVANRAYKLTVGARVIAGTTDGDGFVDAKVNVTAREVLLRIAMNEDGSDLVVLPLRLGHLDPVENESGQRQRLTNLGYGGVGGQNKLEDVVREFQTKEKLEVTGMVDENTQSRLEERHGS